MTFFLEFDFGLENETELSWKIIIISCKCNGDGGGGDGAGAGSGGNDGSGGSQSCWGWRLHRCFKSFKSTELTFWPFFRTPLACATRGAHRPIMNLHERSLSVLACRYVDEVIIGAPWEVSKDMITTFDISLVVHGTVAENNDFQKETCNPYDVPISMGIFKILESPLDITTTTIIRRIVSNHEAYQKRNEKKAESEKRYYEDKTHVSGD
uniref:ethanolamine-phosphate cytidylyltransferase n=1 Tax=Fagus sylvatica TaxID=28930 RepID=A0A2N9F6H3_FAGSY